ncbi:septation protein IspZ [Candidatus Erwinia haradaeae]|uniref:Inner membrane-spanning protein YciB n=1 Tax=Candidatus Erwinia haradaeae TaxID=1922217 RepID=A0A451D2T4_9GAMM|nr:septation protein IspZ [Candidatus Erwinia haradaeae]VFP79975.1 Probable intracellular septation protein A [Candidatus Erwinia haradaeae]
MKLCFDFLPVFIFFMTYKIYDIFIASSVLIITYTIILFLKWFFYRHLDKMSIITFILVLIFGILTVVFHEPDFIKWKTTIIYGLLSIVLFFSHFYRRNPYIKKIFNNEIQLPDIIWRRLNIAWAFFFFFCSLSNVYAIFYLSQERWIDFKFFGLGSLTLFFVFLSGLYIFRCTLVGGE